MNWEIFIAKCQIMPGYWIFWDIVKRLFPKLCTDYRKIHEFTIPEVIQLDNFRLYLMNVSLFLENIYDKGPLWYHRILYSKLGYTIWLEFKCDEAVFYPSSRNSIIYSWDIICWHLFAVQNFKIDNAREKWSDIALNILYLRIWSIQISVLYSAFHFMMDVITYPCWD